MFEKTFFEKLEAHKNWQVDPDGKQSRQFKSNTEYFYDFEVRDVSLKDVQLPRGIFDNITFNNVNFTDSVFTKAIFTNCQFLNCAFGDSNFIEAEFIGSTIKNSTFSYTNFTKSLFKDSTITYVAAANADLTESKILNSKIDNFSLYDVIANKIVFKDNTIKEMHNYSVNFFEAKFENNHMKSVEFNMCNMLAATVQNNVMEDFASIDLSDLTAAKVANNLIAGKTSYVGNKTYNANFTNTKGLYISPIDFIKENFGTTSEGIIAYKVMGFDKEPNPDWKIEENSIITETMNYDRGTTCGCGINVATLKWIRDNLTTPRPIWRVLIKWEWLPGVCVPYNTTGNIRCEKVQLLKELRYTWSDLKNLKIEDEK